MDFDIYFCNDGILRARYTDSYPMVPLSFIQTEEKLSDLSFWVRWWENTVYFEEGLTVSKFLMCLEPWKKFWSEITLKDVSAYIEEARKPTLVSKQETKLDWIDLSYYTEVDPRKEFLDTEEDEELMKRDFTAWINSEKNSRLTGDWEIHSAYKVTGYILNEDEHYSIDYSPMNELANIPIVLNDKHIMIFSGWKFNNFFDENPVFKEGAFGISYLNNNPNQYLLGKKYHRMRDVVEGFFWWLCYSPISRNDFVDSLKDSLNEIKELREEQDNDKVISLYDVKNKKESDKDSEKLKVEVAPGAFSSMISQFERDKDYWNNLLKKAKKESVILKIGEPKKTIPLENRIYNHVIKEDVDVNFYPKPTEFKKN